MKIIRMRLPDGVKAILEAVSRQKEVSQTDLIIAAIQEMGKELDVLQVPLCNERSLKLKQHCDRSGCNAIAVLHQLIDGLGGEE